MATPHLRGEEAFSILDPLQRQCGLKRLFQQLLTTNFAVFREGINIFAFAKTP
jgi:hypothetical protein